MKAVSFVVVLVMCFVGFLLLDQQQQSDGYDIYAYVDECKTELGITEKLPQLSCLDGTQVPIYVNQEEVTQENWWQISSEKQCDNPHWLGGDMGCWTYSHLQVLKLDDDNIMVVNCRQKGNQQSKDWFLKTKANLGMTQDQRKTQFENASPAERKENYFLYNTFNDIGIILRNTRTGKSCYITQYGMPVVGFLPPLDEPLPSKKAFLKRFNPDQVRPPDNFPEELWYRDANQAFKPPAVTAKAGCIDCHNAHGVKYSPHINSANGLPDIANMARLPFLPVGAPFIAHYIEAGYLQVTTDPIDGEPQLCTRCHNLTTSGTCGRSIEFATDHPNSMLRQWLTVSSRNTWMPPIKFDRALAKKHVAAMKCCCQNPQAKGCRSRKFGPTQADLPPGFDEGEGWVRGQQQGLCQTIMSSPQWGGDKL